MKRTRPESNILISQCRNLFKVLEDKVIYVEVDIDTGSILHSSGTGLPDTTFMRIEDILSEKGLEEYKQGLPFVIANPVDIYESIVNAPVLISNEEVINEYWMVSLQPSRIVQVICSKGNKWDSINLETLILMDLPMTIIYRGKTIACNELFTNVLSNFDDIESLLLHTIEQLTPLNIIQDIHGRLIPILMRRSKNIKHIFILLTDTPTTSQPALPIPTPPPIAPPPPPIPISSTNNEGTEFSKEDFSSLVRMEVELKQMEIRIKQLEKFAYLEKNGISARLKEIEVYQDQDNQKWMHLETYKDGLEEKITSLLLINALITNFPGGVKGFIVTSIVIILGCITLIDLGLREYGFKDTINNIEKGIDIIR